MERKEIFDEVVKICRETFENDEPEITESTSAKDIRKWDSLFHVILINAVEQHFDVKFDLDDMLEMTTVGKICDAVYLKLNS